LAFISAYEVPTHARNRPPFGHLSGQADLDRVSAGNVVNYHADWALVGPRRLAPLRIRKPFRVFRKRACALLDTLCELYRESPSP
jgi:hypothetical protein